MQRFSGIWSGVCGALLLVLSGLAGCGPDPEVAAEQKRQEQWQLVEQSKQELDAKRQELAAAREAAAAAAEAAGEEDGEEGDAGEAGEEAAGASGDLAALEAAVDEAAQVFNTQLVEFINANAPVEGEEPTELVGRAIRMKSDVDIQVALEYIDRAGDYRRAIDIYEVALAADPNYQRLADVKAEAESMRYMTEERFAQVEDGMTRDEAKAALGPVNLRNIRDYEENKSIAWFYPKDERGSAAAVWFNQNRKGEYVVYQSDFNFKNEGEEDG